MDRATADRLLELNRKFYDERGRDFSATRLRIQPGVRRIAKQLRGDENVLDLGSGNGAFALELSRAGHRGRYLGIDQSGPLLEHARDATYSFPVDFVEADILELGAPHSQALQRALGADEGPWSVISAFAVLHHLPGAELRLGLLRGVRRWVGPGGIFVNSNWQFSTSPRLSQRIRPWSSLSDHLSVDHGDYLLDWRRGGPALRYVHEFADLELAELAHSSQFAVTDSFHSDGADGRSGLYQVWRPA